MSRIIMPTTSSPNVSTLVFLLLILFAFSISTLFIVFGVFQWIENREHKERLAHARKNIVIGAVGLTATIVFYFVVNIISFILGLGSVFDLSYIRLNF